MDIPTIGRAAGLFSTFVPGLFLLANIVGVLCLPPFADKDARALMEYCKDNQALTVAMGLAFGYLIGIILRLFRASPVDRWSAAWVRAFNPLASQGPIPEARRGKRLWAWVIFYLPWRCYRRAVRKEGHFQLWAEEKFPYFHWLKIICQEYSPPEVKEFYERVWFPRRSGMERLDDRENKQFFNFVKSMINSVDEKAGRQAYAAEELTRYLAGMFYAMVVALCCVVPALVWNGVYTGTLSRLLLAIAAVYGIAACVVLSRFRFVRIKEVETVLAICYTHQARFRGWTPQNPDDPE